MRQLLCVLSWLLPALLPAASHAQLQGKLFTTPEQRAYLDALRRDFLSANSNSGFDIEESAMPPLPPERAVVQRRVEYTLEGILARRDGSHIIWLNQRSFTEKELPEGITLVKTGGGLGLRFSTDGGEKLLLPGQTIEIHSGVVQERYQRTARESAADSDDTSQP